MEYGRLSSKSFAWIDIYWYEFPCSLLTERRIGLARLAMRAELATLDHWVALSTIGYL